MMERLTARDEKTGNLYFSACFREDTCFGMGPDGEKDCSFCPEGLRQAERLAAYEDTGLEPEEITRIKNFVESETAKLLVKLEQTKAERDNYRAALQISIYENLKSFYPTEGLILSEEKRLVEVAKKQCRVCGCTWFRGCAGGCYWADDDLCSKCAEKEEKQE